MKTRDFDPEQLDVAAFAKAGGLLEGEWPVGRLERLGSSTLAAGAQQPVTWRARGELRPVSGGASEVWLHIDAQACADLECQRCLAPVAIPIEAQRSFLFVPGESSAAELDAESEDDVLALTKSLDLPALIEDELLLALPLVPRHEVCPTPLSVPTGDAAADEQAPHPFAALAALKRGGLPN